MLDGGSVLVGFTLTTLLFGGVGGLIIAATDYKRLFRKSHMHRIAVSRHQYIANCDICNEVVSVSTKL